MVWTDPLRRSWRCVSTRWTAAGAGWGHPGSAVDTSAATVVIPGNPPVVHRVVHTLCMGRGGRNQNVTKCRHESDSTGRFRVELLNFLPYEVNDRRTRSRAAITL